jgi:DNA-binding response OmpR family regulator
MTMVSPTRILLVEDSLLFRVLAVEQLENLGFVIETAETAAEAMTKLQQGDGTYAAAIVDIGLPDTKGDLLVADMRAIFPTFPIVIASGCADDEMRIRFNTDDRIAFLDKPYVAEQMRTVLGRLDVFGNS